jgi:DNA-binding IclR family transcriptional regulator
MRDLPMPPRPHNDSERGSGPAYPIESVDRALKVLMILESQDWLSIGEAGELLQISRSSAFRLLKALEYREFVRQDPATKHFSHGPALFRVGFAAVRSFDVRSAARAVLEQVVDAVKETAHSVILQDRKAFYIDCVEGPHVLRATARTGTALPAHLSAAGMVLLAARSNDEIAALLSGELPKLTSRSRTSRREIHREIEAVRARGWALNDGQTEPDLRAVAARLDARRAGIAIDVAITVAGPAARLTDARLKEIARLLLARVSARSIAR